MEFCLYAVLVLTLSTTAVLGRSNGAPMDACATLMPAGHTNPLNQATGDVPFNVDISDIRGCYAPGDMYEIVLSGGMQNTDFRGFIIQAQVAADNSPVGAFMGGENSQPQCINNTAATHTSPAEKTTVTLTWIAPPEGTGTIRFMFAFVDRYAPGSTNMFWSGEETAMIIEGPCVFFNPAMYTVNEDAGVVQPMLYINVPLPNSFTVEVYNTDGTAIGGDMDYTSGPYTVTFPANAASATFDIPIVNDTMYEQNNETFMLAINSSSLPANVSLGYPSQATVTIVDDDATYVTFQQSTYTVNEGAGEIRPVVVLSRSSSSVVTVYAYNMDGTAMGDDDYAPGPYYVMFTAGMDTLSFNISIFDDTEDESDEDFTLTINSTALPMGFFPGNPYEATVTIRDNDGGDGGGGDGGAAAVISSIATLLFASIIALII